MNKIVREHYPVENLPEDLRKLVSGVDHVRLVVTMDDEEFEDDDAPPAPSIEEALEIMRQMQRHTAERGESMTEEEAVRRIRELRDEWDD